jgi:hypothetical protein
VESKRQKIEECFSLIINFGALTVIFKLSQADQIKQYTKGQNSMGKDNFVRLVGMGH